jgi:hypothetical protein
MGYFCQAPLGRHAAQKWKAFAAGPGRRRPCAVGASRPAEAHRRGKRCPCQVRGRRDAGRQEARLGGESTRCGTHATQALRDSAPGSRPRRPALAGLAPGRRGQAGGGSPLLPGPPSQGWCVCRPAPQGEAAPCGSPVSRPEPPRAVGAESSRHHHALAGVPRWERGRPPEAWAGAQATHGRRRLRRRQRTRRQGKPGTRGRTPEAEPAPGLLAAARPMPVGRASPAQALTTLGVIPAAACASVERPVPCKGHAGCGGGREETDCCQECALRLSYNSNAGLACRSAA